MKGYKEIYRSSNENYEQIFTVDSEWGVLGIETIYHPKYKIDKNITFVTVMDLMAVKKSMEAIENEKKASKKGHSPDANSRS